jgi:hypothetical protein
VKKIALHYRLALFVIQSASTMLVELPIYFFEQGARKTWTTANEPQ